MNKYKVAITVIPLEDGTYMAHCESLRAVAEGDTSEEAVENLREAVEDLIQEFGESAVFQDIQPNIDLRVLECAV